MIYKCPNCAAALVFDALEHRLVCRSCDSRFQPEEIDMNYLPTMHMEFNIYSCTACGGEIMVTDTEAATYCIYCGQPVVVFERVSSELQPDYIVPFQITKEAAQASLRYRVRKNFFVPKEFKNFKIDTLRGIYVPFWMYNMVYHDKQYFHVERKTFNGLNQETFGYVKEAQTIFRELPINASHILSDKELQLLGKYNLGKKVPFNPGYLSGFYADRYDIHYELAAGQAIQKAGDIFDQEAVQFLQKSGYEGVYIEYKNPQAVIKGIGYILLPVWFMTFQYKGNPYTLLVNGQTGMAAGNLPINKVKATMLFLFYSIIIAPIFLLFSYGLYGAYTHDQLTIFLIILVSFAYLIAICLGWMLGRRGIHSIKSGLNFSRSARVQKYIKKRQEI